MNDSCASSIHNYECGIEPIQQLQAIVSGAPGVLGSRFSGGGYGGCVVGLVKDWCLGSIGSEIVSRLIKGSGGWY